MSIDTIIENINNTYNNIDLEVQRIKTNVENSIDTVATRGKLILNGDETIEDLPSLIESVETHKSYPNGTSWELVSTITYPTCICYGNGIWVVGSTSSTSLPIYSRDGKNWSEISLSVYSEYIEFPYIAYNDGMWVAATPTTFVEDTASNFVYYSTDGINWSPGNLTSLTDSDTVIGIEYGNYMWILQTSFTMHYSKDGINWSDCDMSNLTNFKLFVSSVNSNSTGNQENIMTYHYDNGIWVSLSAHGIIYSTDGIAWYESNITSSASSEYLCDGVLFANGVWVTGYNKILYYSTDGVTWNTSNLSFNSHCSVIFHNGMWLFSNYQGLLYYSTDGITWTHIINNGLAHLSRFSDKLYSHSFDPKLSISALYSVNGTEWNTIVGSTNTPYVVGYNCGVYIGISNNALCYSFDGINFTDFEDEKLLLNNITFKNNKILPQSFYKNGVWLITVGNKLFSSTCWEL